MIVDIAHEAKRKLKNPYITIAGDFNQFNMEKALEEHVDIKRLKTGNTRGNKCLDQVFTNYNRTIKEKGVLAPLQSEAGANSDHGVVFLRALLEKREKTEWLTYWTRKYSEKKEKAFGEWLAGQDWQEVLTAPTSNSKAEAYQTLVQGAMDKFFPLTRTRRKTGDSILQ
jgi:hypothetical protein